MGHHCAPGYCALLYGAFMLSTFVYSIVFGCVFAAWIAAAVCGAKQGIADARGEENSV